MAHRAATNVSLYRWSDFAARDTLSRHFFGMSGTRLVSKAEGAFIDAPSFLPDTGSLLDGDVSVGLINLGLVSDGGLAIHNGLVDNSIDCFGHDDVQGRIRIHRCFV